MNFLCVLNFEKLHLGYMVDLLIKLSEAEFFLCMSVEAWHFLCLYLEVPLCNDQELALVVTWCTSDCLPFQ